MGHISDRIIILALKLGVAGAQSPVLSTNSIPVRLKSVEPTSGSSLGGTRLSIEGSGFTTDFFAAFNEVQIGRGDTWVVCDVIEGACTVDCGGPKRIVCDTGPWVREFEDITLDLKVKVTRDLDVMKASLTNAFTYKMTTHGTHPMLTAVTPSAVSANGVLDIKGHAFGASIKDYLSIYLGVGRAPQGGNIQPQEGVMTSTDTGFKRTSHAQCRTEDLNYQADAVDGEISGERGLIYEYLGIGTRRQCRY